MALWYSLALIILQRTSMPTSDSKQHYRRNPDLIAADMDGDVVMMSIDRGDYYGIGGVGARVWELLESPKTLDDIVQTICREFEVDQVRCHVDMARFLDELQAHGVVSLDAG